jgi:hypothetical protein
MLSIVLRTLRGSSRTKKTGDISFVVLSLSASILKEAIYRHPSTKKNV